MCTCVCVYLSPKTHIHSLSLSNYIVIGKVKERKMETIEKGLTGVCQKIVGRPCSISIILCYTVHALYNFILAQANVQVQRAIYVLYMLITIHNRMRRRVESLIDKNQ